MRRFRLSLGISAAALSLVLAAAAPALALNLVSYASRYTGSDANSCGTPTAPCQNVGAALAKTAPGGEIKCFDNYFETGFVIDKPITIDCGAPGSLLAGVAGANGITVNLDAAIYPNGVVTLRNLTLSGLLGNGVFGTGNFGIHVIGGGGAVHVENCTIQGFVQQGIDFAPTSNVDLFVRDTIISDNQGGGVFVHPAAAAAVRGSLSEVRLDRNKAFGLIVAKASGAGVAITVDDTQVERDGIGLRASGASAFILLSRSTIAHNTTGLQVLNGGKIVSSGNNTLFFNTTNGAPTSTAALK